jgi:hypothetical protein
MQPSLGAKLTDCDWAHWNERCFTFVSGTIQIAKACQKFAFRIADGPGTREHAAIAKGRKLP